MQAIKTLIFRLPSINLYFLLDNLIKNIFKIKTISHYNNLNKPYGIIINDNMLKFHDNDIRKQISKKLV